MEDAMHLTIITMILALVAIFIGGCDVDIEGISDTPKVGKADGAKVVVHDLGEKNFGTFWCRGACEISVLNPDGSAASIWRSLGPYEVLDEDAGKLDGYLAENEFLDFELTEGQTIHVELIESPPENGAEQMTLVSHQQAYQFTNNRGVPTCYLPIYTSVGEPRAYFVELVPDGTCS
ncbi:MAG: hypothetical protein UV82_C0014G0011 [Candidatus Magasanikbacteria bacterium GW2011_GWD2_43_18]|nr:MAG: hypothetical protein UV18_C0008G0007 [Candidatus Magasanikbacteria bacterium GW2011_GWC2_42_27]KKT03870.1 MAG: hypothetical protein UV82_C0014G0011 [Candidatus Magasanikbacteria bacterium GW2011_GWD2_43_18]KKT25727.1 MAG: hypothetical protein UW10_C0004G0002 [Candidatus Magasanikbacteria bacterium GW2011_GWA2_43_9]HBB38245.1 hypothetical protein [Candidatus Magasanikbacteria bacterium]HCC14001.1 hypothetical protein [Candidatus Magasanikbacteria bacterium]